MLCYTMLHRAFTIGIPKNSPTAARMAYGLRLANRGGLAANGEHPNTQQALYRFCRLCYNSQGPFSVPCDGHRALSVFLRPGSLRAWSSPQRRGVRPLAAGATANPTQKFGGVNG